MLNEVEDDTYEFVYSKLNGSLAKKIPIVKSH